MKPIERTGQTYGMLTVTGDAPSKGGHTYKHCLCKCGKTVDVATSNLSKTLSCGCGKEDNLSPTTYKSLYWQKKTFCRPVKPVRKSEVSLADRADWPRGYWLCICTLCAGIFPASTEGLMAGLSTLGQRPGDVVSCPGCDIRARALLEGRWYNFGDNRELEQKVLYTRTKSNYWGTVLKCRDLTNKRYGQRGIKVCDRWLEPKGKGLANFIEDMGIRPQMWLSLHRIDGDGDYCKANCVWATSEVQSRNKSTSVKYLVNGKQINLVDLAALVGRDSKSVSRTIAMWKKYGHTVQHAIEQMMADTHTVR